jgi:hypothetical protein
MRRNSQIEFYVDCLIIEALASNNTLIKNAGEGSGINSLIESVKSYFDQRFDDNNPKASVLAMLAPGTIYLALRGFSTKLAFALALASSIFGIDVKNALVSVYDYVKGNIEGDKPISSKSLEDAVNKAVDANTKKSGTSSPTETPPTPTSRSTSLTSRRVAPSGGFDLTGSNFSLEDAKLISLALDENNFEKLASASKLGLFSGAIKKILFWLFAAVLSSAGFLVAGDAVNAVLGRPSAFTGTLKEPMTAPTPAQTAAKIFAGPKPPVKPSYSAGRYNNINQLWQINMTANRQNMQDTIVKFLRQVYQGLDDAPGSSEKYNTIVNSRTFALVLNQFIQENKPLISSSSNIFFVPFIFKNEKQIADYMIVDITEDLRKKNLLTL